MHAHMYIRIQYIRGAQPFWAKGRSALFLVHSRNGYKIVSLSFESRVSKIRFFKI